MEKKFNEALAYLESELTKAVNPFLIASFGKDSTLVLWMCKRIGRMPKVLYHWMDYFNIKNREEFTEYGKYNFILDLKNAWSFEIYNWNSTGIDLYSENKNHAIYVEYLPFNGKNIVYPSHLTDVYDGNCMAEIIEQYMPKEQIKVESDLLISGSKASDFSDPDMFFTTEDGYRKKKIEDDYKGIRYVQPLWDFTNEEVWDIIERYEVPYDKAVYKDRKRILSEKINACWRCLNPNQPKEVDCPKLAMKLDNIMHNSDYQRKLQDFYIKEQVFI